MTTRLKWLAARSIQLRDLLFVCVKLNAKERLASITLVIDYSYDWKVFEPQFSRILVDTGKP